MPSGCASVASSDPSGVRLSDYDRGELEQNKLWIKQRAASATATTLPETSPAQVGVYADAGVWHLGARSIALALESSGVPCDIIDRTSLTSNGLQNLRVLIVPGGWAPLERDVNPPAA